LNEAYLLLGNAIKKEATSVDFTSAFHPKALNMKKNGRSPGFPELTGLLTPINRDNGMVDGKSLS
jgi:hypothetical protein